MDMAMMLKPAPLMLKKKGDPEQLHKDWEDYLKVFNEFLKATGIVEIMLILRHQTAPVEHV